MSQTRYIRSSDRLEFFSAESTGFVTRKASKGNVALHYFLLAAMVAAGTTVVVYFQLPPAGWLGISLMGGIMLTLSLEMSRVKRHLFASEFLSALLASAVSKGHQFCAIATVKGDIAYVNRPFQALFDSFSQLQERKVATLLTQAKVAQSDQDKLLALVEGNKEGSVKLKLEDEQGISHSMTLTVEPILRPTGFVLIRGN